jgi:YXWGXW repeat-containing protein
MKRFLGTLAVGVLAMTLTSSAAQAGARVYVRVGPPAPLAEVRVAAPSPHHVWIAGYHRWDGAAYVWVPGRWDLPPAHHTAWVAGHWVHHASNGWYWNEGHWR